MHDMVKWHRISSPLDTNSALIVITRKARMIKNILILPSGPLLVPLTTSHFSIHLKYFAELMVCGFLNISNIMSLIM